MQVIIKGSPKEIATLVVEVQERQNARPKFVPETSEGPCLCTEKVTTGASGIGNPKSPC